jgi:4-amino-4-deoxy-L-arabinose transferase-like glycosyltransferase
LTQASAPSAATPRTGVTVLLLAALCVPLYFVATGCHDLDMKGEPREAITAWETIHGPDWLLPVLNGERLPEKPILFPWLVALSMRVFGETSEWAVRLPSALMATGLVFVVFGIGRRLLGERAGAVAAFATAGTFLVVSLARRARVDMTLSFFACFALLQFVAEFQRDESDPTSRPSPWRLLAFWLAIALATLTKGPLGAILVGLPVGALLLVRWRLAFVKKLCPWWGVLLCAVVAGSWYAHGLTNRGGEFGFRAFLMENVLMFFGSEGGGGHRHGFLYLVPYYFFFGLPWSLVLPAAVVLVARRARGAWRAEPLVLPLVWFATQFLFFSVASGKRSDYLLPLLPAAALVVAGAWDAAPRSQDALARRALAVSAWALAVLGGILIAALVFAAKAPDSALPEGLAQARGNADVRALLATAGASPLATALVLASLLVTAAAPAASLVLKRPERGIVASAAAFAVGVGTAAAVFLPSYAASDSLKTFTADALRIAGGAPLRSWSSFEPQVLFYANRRIPSLDRELPSGDDDAAVEQRRRIGQENHAALVAYLAEPGPRYVLTTRDMFEAMAPDVAPSLEVVLESHREDRSREDQSLLLRRVPSR